MDTYYKIGGCLNPNHPTYVNRKADQELFEYLKHGEYCYILNSHQMGKSSLRVKTAKKLRAERVKCAFIDITLIGSLVTLDKWYQGFANLLLNSLELDTEFDFNNFWECYNNLPEVQRLYKLIEFILLKLISNNLVIFIDEVLN